MNDIDFENDERAGWRNDKTKIIEREQIRLRLCNMLGNEVISYAQAQPELTPLEEALLNTLLNNRIRP